MDCPQCEAEDALTTYTDGEREAFVCENCGYVGIPADHRGEAGESETWADAVSRFHEHHPFLRDGEPPGAETPVENAVGRPSRPSRGPETWDEALRAFQSGDDEAAGSDPAGGVGESESGGESVGGRESEDGAVAESGPDGTSDAVAADDEAGAEDGEAGADTAGSAATDAPDGVGPNA
jgi:Zn ribbon nucleic-acid-binding protein